MLELWEWPVHEPLRGLVLGAMSSGPASAAPD